MPTYRQMLNDTLVLQSMEEDQQKWDQLESKIRSIRMITEAPATGKLVRTALLRDMDTLAVTECRLRCCREDFVPGARTVYCWFTLLPDGTEEWNGFEIDSIAEAELFLFTEVYTSTPQVRVHFLEPRDSGMRFIEHIKSIFHHGIRDYGEQIISDAQLILSLRILQQTMCDECNWEVH